MSSNGEGLVAFATVRLAEAWSAARDRELAFGLDESFETRAVDALRAILLEHADVHDCGDPRSWQFEYVGCRDARAIAAIWDDHERYREDWKP